MYGLRRLTRTLARLLLRMAALAVLVGLLAGVPAGLVHYVGSPLPDHIPSRADIVGVLTSPMTDDMIGHVVVGLVWVVWAAFVWSTVVETAARLTHATPTRPVLLAPLHTLAAALVGAITAGILASGVQATASAAPGPTRTPVVAAALATPHTATPTTASNPAAPSPAPAAAAVRQPAPILVTVGDREYTYTVVKHDTLSKIARDWLGDADRWPEICRLNHHHRWPQVGGRLTNCNLIYPGWVLQLPVDARPPVGAKPLPTAPPPATTTPAPDTAPSPSTPASASSGTAAPPSPTPSAPAPPSPPAGVVDPDGVTDPAPTTPATPTAPAAASSGSATASPSPFTPARQAADPPGVGLPGGGWVDLGLAAAIAAAAALVWIQRARRHTPDLTDPDLDDDPDLTPLPEVVTAARRGLRRRRDPDTPPASDPTATEQPAEAEADGDRAVPVAERPTGPASNPALGEALSAAWPPAGVGLVGPGAHAAARGFLISTLAAGHTGLGAQRGRVVIAARTLATLLGTAAVDVADTPRLTITTGLAEALTLLETETLHRSRLLYDHEADTTTTLREAGPGLEPLPPILLIADTTAAHEQARVAALLTQGQRLDIHGVLLGPWPAGTTVRVAADGTTSRHGTDSRHGTHVADIARLAVLDPAHTGDLLRTLHEAHTGQPAPPAPAEHPTMPPRRREPTRPGGTTVADPPHPTGTGPVTAASATPAASISDDAPAPPTGAARLHPTTPALPRSADPGEAPAADVRDDEDDPDEADDQPANDGGAPVPLRRGRARVVLLGPPRIDAADPGPGAVTRSVSIELLVYLAVHRDGARASQIKTDLMGDLTRDAAKNQLWTAVSGLRKLLRHAGGPGTYVEFTNRTYRLDPDTVDVDLWHVHDAIAEAKDATSEPTRLDALRRAVAAHGGPLAAGHDYEWIEPHREHTRREALRAHLYLAKALTDHHPDQALQVIDAAITHNPHTEVAYQQAMRIHARLGDHIAIRRLRRNLIRTLADIDAKPDPRTLALADQLSHQLTARPSDSP